MEIVPLAQGFGARISGFDPHMAEAEAIAALQAAYDEHHLLIFKGLGVVPGELHAEIAGWFGPVGANRAANGQPWTYLDNEDAVGSAVLPFHCDIAYMEHPFLGLSLHPVALPEGGSSTTFVSNAVGWDALDEDLKELLAERKAASVFRDVHVIDAAWPPLVAWHPVCLPHPRTGRPLVFVNENHVTEIEGLDEAESAPILQRIFATIYAPEQRYEHHWQEGDLLVWDNLAIQHARTQVAAPSAGRRVIQRVALGTHTFQEQVAALIAAGA